MPYHCHSIDDPYEGYTNLVATQFCTVVPNICGSSVWNFLHVTILAPRILRWLLDFWKICAPMLHTYSSLTYGRRYTILATGTVTKLSTSSGRGKRFCSIPKHEDRLWGLPLLLFNVHRGSLPGSKVACIWCRG